MTTLASWVGVDQRAPASLYIVSDSQLTLIGGSHPRVLTKQGRKVFACTKEPHLFGYWGSVAFPTRVIGEAVRFINAGTFFASAVTGSARQTVFERYVKSELNSFIGSTGFRRKPMEFAILHAFRDGEGMDSRFHLWILGWNPNDGWRVREREIPEASEVLYAGGSGAEAFLQRSNSWKDSEIGRTSRGVFSGFVQALQAKYDEYSGGAPQLAGLFRRGRPPEFGVIFDNERYLRGKPVSVTDIPPHIEWFNELFERADPVTLRRIQHAQRHAQPSWLRPYERRAK